MLEGGAPAGIDAEETVREATGDVTLDPRADDDPRTVRSELDRRRVSTVVAVERDVIGHQKATRAVGENLDRQVQLVAIDRRPRAHLNDAAVVLVDPATAARRH